MRTFVVLLIMTSISAYGQISMPIDSLLAPFKRHKEIERRTIDELRTLIHMRCWTDSGAVDLFIEQHDKTPEVGTVLNKNGQPLPKAKIVSYKGWNLKKFFQIQILQTNEIWEYTFLTQAWSKRSREWSSGDSNSTERPHAK